MSDIAALLVRQRKTALDAAVAELAARQHGVVTLRQLGALGLGARGVQQRASRGRLHRLHRGVYAVGHRLLTPDGFRMAAVLAGGPGAVLGRRSAADAWGIRRTARAKHEVIVPSQRRPRPGIDLLQTRSLHPDDVTTLRGIPITTVARTFVDLASVLAAHALERGLHEADYLGLVDARAVHEALARANGRRGTTTLKAVLAEPDPGPTRSELEERFLALCGDARLPRPRLNVRVGPFEVDALWPDEGVIVELDGAAAHHTRKAFHADRRRDAALLAAGFVVMRLTWPRVVDAPGQVAAELRQLLTRRAPR